MASEKLIRSYSLVTALDLFIVSRYTELSTKEFTYTRMNMSINTKTFFIVIGLACTGIIALEWFVLDKPQNQSYTMNENEPLPDNSLSASEETAAESVITHEISHAISIGSEAFLPTTLTARVGETLALTNTDTVPHQVAFGNHNHHTLYPGYTEQELAPGATLEIALTTPGDYFFHDHLNDEVKGEITITTAGGELSLMPANHHDEMDRFMNSSHMKVTPSPAPTPEEARRASETLAAIKAATEKYTDYRVAEQAGYINQNPKPYKAGAKNERHFSSGGGKKFNTNTLDPAHPTSLLYEMDATGDYHLKGVMFTAPIQADESDLNERYFPISETIWHKHLNKCKIKGEDVKGVTTPEACKAKGGTFREESNWMTHLYF